jgi:hypothetical protein
MTLPPNDGEATKKSLDARRRIVMSIADPKRSALGLPNLDQMVPITKTLISAAIALGSCVGLAASASADPNPADAGLNPYSTLSCNCQETAPAGSPALREEIRRGNQEGLSASLPGLPRPTQPRQPRP